MHIHFNGNKQMQIINKLFNLYNNDNYIKNNGKCKIHSHASCQFTVLSGENLCPTCEMMRSKWCTSWNDSRW